MKKLFFSLILVCLASMLLAGCGKPKYMTQKTYDNGCRALEVMEKYNDMEISSEEAEERLTSIQASIQSERASLTNSYESTNNLLVDTDILLFITALHGTSGSTYDQEDALRELLEK